MIAKGNLHAHGGRLASYMMTGKGAERAELVEVRGIAAADLRDGFRDIQCIAEGQTRCIKPFFHAYVRLPEGEELDSVKWLAVADRIEIALGFEEQPRAVAFHIGEDGETHMHIAWSRIDVEEMRALDPGLYKNKLKEICRTLEEEYGLQAIKNEREPEQQTKGPARPEFEAARRLGVDVEATREAIRDCFDRSDNGPSFAAALGEFGMNLARGDRRDYVVIDTEGGMHAVGKRICGVSADEVRRRFGSEFQQSLPSVDEVREQLDAQRSALAEEQATHSAGGAGRSRDDISDEVTEVWTASDTGQIFRREIEARGYILARGNRRDFLLIDGNEKPRSLPRLIQGVRIADVRVKLAGIDASQLPDVDEALATMERRATITDQQRRRGGMDEQLTEDGLKRQVQLEADQLAAANAIKEKLAAFEAQKQSAADAARQDEQKRRQADERRSAEGEPNSAESRYAQALGQNYDMRDPYGSLARAAMAEYGQFQRQREELRKEAAREKDPAARAEIELRMKVEGCEYMAITSHRIAGISAVVSGRDDSAQAKADRERAQFWQQEAAKAREQRAQQMESRPAQQQKPAVNDQGPRPSRDGTIRATAQQPQTTNDLRPNETAESRAASPQTGRIDREAQEFKAAGIDKTQTAQPPRTQPTRGGSRGR